MYLVTCLRVHRPLITPIHFNIFRGLFTDALQRLFVPSWIPNHLCTLPGTVSDGCLTDIGTETFHILFCCENYKRFHGFYKCKHWHCKDSTTNSVGLYSVQNTL